MTLINKQEKVLTKQIEKFLKKVKDDKGISQDTKNIIFINLTEIVPDCSHIFEENLPATLTVIDPVKEKPLQFVKDNLKVVKNTLKSLYNKGKLSKKYIKLFEKLVLDKKYTRFLSVSVNKIQEERQLFDILESMDKLVNMHTINHILYIKTEDPLNRIITDSIRFHASNWMRFLSLSQKDTKKLINNSCNIMGELEMLRYALVYARDTKLYQIYISNDKLSNTINQLNIILNLLIELDKYKTTKLLVYNVAKNKRKSKKSDNKTKNSNKVENVKSNKRDDNLLIKNDTLVSSVEPIYNPINKQVVTKAIDESMEGKSYESEPNLKKSEDRDLNEKMQSTELNVSDNIFTPDMRDSKNHSSKKLKQAPAYGKAYEPTDSNNKTDVPLTQLEPNKPFESSKKELVDVKNDLTKTINSEDLELTNKKEDESDMK